MFTPEIISVYDLCLHKATDMYFCAGSEQQKGTARNNGIYIVELEKLSVFIARSYSFYLSISLDLDRLHQMNFTEESDKVTPTAFLPP